MSWRKLKETLKKSPKVIMDGEDKFVFISDVHRGDGGYNDTLIGNKNIYLSALKYYYKEEYTLVEVGDGDELWKNKNCIDIAYTYKEVFQILNRFNKKNRLYMIYGNHDIQKKKKNFRKVQNKIFNKIEKGFGEDFLFLINNINFYEGVIFKYKPNDGEIFVTHGHQLDFMNSSLALVSRILVRYFWRTLEGIAGFKEPITPANNYEKGNRIDEKFEEFSKESKKMIICGHTHKVRFPEAYSGHYFNDGCCVNPGTVTTLEINKGIIAMVKWSVEAGEKNILYIKRSVIDGPEKLGGYLKFE